MAYEQQIAKLKGYAIAFTDELEWIIQCFELVQPTIMDLDLETEFMGNKRRLGFRIFQRIVARDCVIGITRVTFDHGPKNPTARKIITALTCPGANQLREELKSAFARPFIPGEVPGRPLSELDLTAFEEMDKIETAGRQQTYDDHISQLKEHWKWFSEYETKFKDSRDKRLAHLDVSKFGDKYEPTEIGSFGWNLVVEALRRLIEIAKLLSAILGNPSRNFDQFESFAQETAKDFWQIE
jgi:hypothetical protein